MQGQGTQTNPYVIETSEEFWNQFSKSSPYKQTFYKLGCDVDLTSITSKGIQTFANVYLDGDGHKLTARITEENICMIEQNISYGACALFTTFKSSELHNLQIDLSLDLDFSTISNIKNLRRLRSWCGLFWSTETYTSTDKNVIEDCEIVINYVFKKYIENDVTYLETSLFALGYKIDTLEVKNIKLRNNISTSSTSTSFGSVYMLPSVNTQTIKVLDIKGYNALYYNFNSDSIDTITVIPYSYFNLTDVQTTSNISSADILHGSVYEDINMIIENPNFVFRGRFRTVDLNIDTTDNLNGSLRVNVKADKVRNLNFKRDNFIADINDKNEIDIYSSLVENMTLNATKRVDGHIFLHNGVYRNIDVAEETQAEIYLNEDSVIAGTTFLNKVDNTDDNWNTYYSWLHFKPIDEYTDFLRLYTGREWVIVPLYDDGDIRFYISDTEYKFLRFDDSLDIKQDIGLKFFPISGTYKDGRVIKTIIET